MTNFVNAATNESASGTRTHHRGELAFLCKRCDALTERASRGPLYHAGLARHFSAQQLWLGAVPNGRRATELVRQQVRAGLLDHAEATLTNLQFIAAKCAAELVFDLQDDYQEAISVVPEAKVEVQEQEHWQAALDCWAKTLTMCARERRLPKPGNIIRSVDPWTDERIAEERRRLIEHPTRVDRLRAFARFVEEEYYPLLEFGKRPGFVLQQAFNYAPRGTVRSAAILQVDDDRFPKLLRRWPAGADYNPEPALLRSMEGHAGKVNTVALTPNGRQAVSGADDGVLKVWDLKSGVCLRTLVGHKGTVWSVACTADGRRVVSVSSDSTLKLWDLPRGTCLRTWEMPGAGRSLAVTADGRQAICGFGDSSVKLWDLEAGTCLHTLVGHVSSVCSVSATADGRKALAADTEGTLKLWDLESGACLRTMEGRKDDVITVVATAADGKRAVSGSLGKRMRLWDLETGECLSTFGPIDGPTYISLLLQGYSHQMTSIAISADGRRAVSGSLDQTLKLWDLEGDMNRRTPIDLRTLKGHTDTISSVAMTADGRRAVSASADGTLKVWDLERSASTHTNKREERISVIAVTPDGRAVVAVARNRLGRQELKLWKSESGSYVRAWEGHTGVILAVSVAADGRRLVTASNDGVINVWELDTGACICTMNDDDLFFRSVLVADNGSRAVSVSLISDTLKLWDLETGLCLRTIEGDAESEIFFAVGLTADGWQAVSVSRDNVLRIWDLKTGECRLEQLDLLSDGTSIWVTGDGRLAVSRSKDTRLRVWDLETGLCRHTLEAQVDDYDSVLSLPNARAISTSANRAVRLWDLEAGYCLAVLRRELSVDLRKTG